MSRVLRPLDPLGLSHGLAAKGLLGAEDLARSVGRASLVRLGMNESAFGPSPKAVAAIHAEAGRANRYGDPSLLELRSALAAKHGVALENVTVGAGIDDLLSLIVRAYVPAGATAIAALGTFPTFEMHVSAVDAYVERVPYLPDGRLDLAGLAAATHRLAGGLIFLPNPDNPSGSAYAWSDVLTFLDTLPDGTLVIHDEAYGNFLPPPARFPPAALDPRVVRCRTFSKEYGLAGMRVGYALGTRETIEAIDGIRQLYGVGRLAQVAALAALGDGAFIEDVVRMTAEGREEYAALGKRLGLPTLPSTTNFVLFDFGSRERAEAAQAALVRLGFHVRKPAHPPLDRCVRVSVGAPSERAEFAAALKTIGDRSPEVKIRVKPPVPLE
jgi:histidinol-phosphate aminotransferase